MTAPQRIQRKRTKGWRLPDGAVCVDRSTRWGNPFKAGIHYDHQYAVDLFQMHFTSAVEFRLSNKQMDRLKDEGADVGQFLCAGADILQLRGKDLACWCALDQPCHADVLLKLANA